MKQLVIFPKGSLSPKDKERMSKEGFLAIETNDPSQVVMLLPSGGILGADDILMAAMAGVMTEQTYSAKSKEAMVAEMHRRLKKREEDRLSNAELRNP